jgi:hypothetical protein
MALYELLVDFANERENIRVNRAKGKNVLTFDPILGRYRFCNVRRRHDRVSRWLLENYYKTNVGDVWFRALIARLVNWPPTLQHLMDKKVIPVLASEFKPDEFIAAMEELRHQKVKLYSSAYIVYPTRAKGNSKAENMTKMIIAPAIEKGEQLRTHITFGSIEKFVNELASSFGIKTFIAGQVAADLTYIHGQLDNAYDLYSWAPMGPGSQRGLNRLHERYLKKKISEVDFNSELIDARGKLIHSNKLFEDLTLHDVQNVMCEFDKYMRVMRNEGKPRQLYRPEGAF